MELLPIFSEGLSCRTKRRKGSGLALRPSRFCCLSRPTAPLPSSGRSTLSSLNNPHFRLDRDCRTTRRLRNAQAAARGSGSFLLARRSPRKIIKLAIAMTAVFCVTCVLALALLELGLFFDSVDDVRDFALRALIALLAIFAIDVPGVRRSIL